MHTYRKVRFSVTRHSRILNVWTSFSMDGHEPFCIHIGGLLMKCINEWMNGLQRHKTVKHAPKTKLDLVVEKRRSPSRPKSTKMRSKKAGNTHRNTPSCHTWGTLKTCCGVVGRAKVICFVGPKRRLLSLSLVSAASVPAPLTRAASIYWVDVSFA